MTHTSPRSMILSASLLLLLLTALLALSSAAHLKPNIGAAATGAASAAAAPAGQPASLESNRHASSPFNACPGFPQLTAFVDKHKHSMCKIGPSTGGSHPTYCLDTVALIPCHMMAANLFYAYSGKRLAEVQAVKHNIARRRGLGNALMAEDLQDMQVAAAQQPQVYAFEVQLDNDYAPCGGVHLFTVVLWPSHSQSGGHGVADSAAAVAPATAPSHSCLFQSFGAQSKHANHMFGYSLRQWFSGWDVDHAEQQIIRLPQLFGKGVAANARGFERARQHAMRTTATFAQLMKQLMDPDTLPDAFEELFGCRPQPTVVDAAGTGASRAPQVAQMIWWKAPATLSGFTSLEEVMKSTKCSHK